MKTKHDISETNVARLPMADAAEAFPSADWRAAWIWTREGTEGIHDYVSFRREFEVAKLPKQALLRIAAERDATVWINGELIAYGPPISDPRFKRYETHDITSHIAGGVNCVAVRVYHDATKRGAFTAHADARGLLCQLELDGAVEVVTDERWRARRSRAYIKPSVQFGDSMWPEFFDANQDTPGWTSPGFDASGWPAAACVIASTHQLWAAAQPQARFYPWVNLIPCETRPLRRERLLPVAVQTVGEVILRREAQAQDTAVRMSLEPVFPVEKTSIEGVEGLLSGNGSVTIRNSSLEEPYETFDGLRNATIVLDFGRLINARIGIRLDTTGGSVDVGYAYQLEDNRVVPFVSNRSATANHYIARSGNQTWETADWHHFRYIQLTFRNLREPLILHSVWAEAVGNHFESRGEFVSNDQKLQKIFEIVKRTADLNTVDRTMDNPSRERKQYLGDCSSILSAITSCFGDAAILRRYFANVAEGQHATGQYRYSYPGHDADRASLFDHALSLPLRLWEHYRLFADKTLVESMWSGLERFLQLMISCLGKDDRIVLPPYNVFFDWGHMDRRGVFLPLQAMAIEALRCSAELADAIGVDAAEWHEHALRMKARIPDWFDPERGVFVDAIVDGERQRHCSEHANSLIAKWKLAPDAMIQSALQRWSVNREEFGQASPAWEYLPSAFFCAGRPELAIRWMHERLGQIERRGLETWPETWCLHGERTTGSWRCRNSRAVAQGAGLGIPTALLEGLCGIQPGTPGFRTVYLVPQPGSLDFVRGVRPGPDGDYTLELSKNADGWRLILEIPSARPVTLDAAFAPGARARFASGERLEPVGEVELGGGVSCNRFKWQAERKTELYFV